MFLLSDHSNAYLADSLIEYHYGIAPIENESTVQKYRKEITSQSSTQMKISEIIFFMNSANCQSPLNVNFFRNFVTDSSQGYIDFPLVSEDLAVPARPDQASNSSGTSSGNEGLEHSTLFNLAS